MRKIILRQITNKGRKCDILIEGNRIKEISDFVSCEADIVLDCKGREVLPGFVNMHTHSAMTLMRGVEEDCTLQEWLDRIWSIESHLDDEMILWGTKLAILEMLKSGTTCFLDMYWSLPMVREAVEQMGIRANLSYVFLTHFDSQKAEQQKRECQEMFEASKQWGERCSFSVAIHADYTVDEKTMIWASEFAKSNSLILHTHIAETWPETEKDFTTKGMSPVKYYDSLGILDENTVAAHCVWINEEDIEILGKRKVNVVHNINSNLKLSSGYKFKYNELRDAGANVCLGTDGAASSNNLDILETMKTSSFMQKAWRNDPKAMPIDELMNMSSLNGANALNLNAGKIEVGALADLIIVDTNSEAFIPNVNFEGNLIFAANSSCIKTVICNGEIVMSERKVRDEEQIREVANMLSEKLLKISK